MNDFISRESAVKAITEYKVKIESENMPEITKCCFQMLNITCDKNIGFINSIPAADVQPVKRGKWIDVTETAVSGKTKDGRELEINIVSGKCSCCQHYAEQVNILPPIMQYSICPNCGAKMEEE